jgi:DNA-directed RNA polymerase
LYGYDKASFQERVEWVHTHLDLIRDSAENPLSGQRWWVNADDPWQCLATCKELISALDSPDPTKFKSSLPVHQDGTCNGLQHYAALGGDLDGARQVNLVDSDRPSDVYTHVASLVEKMIDEDVEKGTEVAKLLQGKISRKVVKQTVMTTVYGVTFIGARDQIGKQLKDKSVVPADMVWDCSSYLAKKVCSFDTLHRSQSDHWYPGPLCDRQSLLWREGNHDLVLRVRAFDLQIPPARPFRYPPPEGDFHHRVDERCYDGADDERHLDYSVRPASRSTL